jgi:hypothetical protein
MDIETKRTYIGIRVAKAQEDLATAQEMLRLEHWRDEQDYKDLVRPLDQATTTQIVRDAERFVTRLERYLRQVGAIE